MQETYTETRDVTDAAGNNFTCEYSLVYDSSSAKVYRQQSGVACLPNVNGKQTIEDVVIKVRNVHRRTDKDRQRQTIEDVVIEVVNGKLRRSTPCFRQSTRLPRSPTL